MKARGAQVYVITDNPKLARGLDSNPIIIPNNGPLTALIAVLPLQVWPRVTSAQLYLILSYCQYHTPYRVSILTFFIFKLVGLCHSSADCVRVKPFTGSESRCAAQSSQGCHYGLGYKSKTDRTSRCFDCVTMS